MFEIKTKLENRCADHGRASLVAFCVEGQDERALIELDFLVDAVLGFEILGYSFVAKADLGDRKDCEEAED